MSSHPSFLLSPPFSVSGIFILSTGEATAADTPLCTAAEGLAAVEVANAIVAACQEHKWDGATGERAGLDILKK